jgi:hypothetical protein
MTRIFAATASLALLAGAAGAETYIQDGSEVVFPAVAVGSSSATSVYFGLGETGQDESFIYGDGPEFDLISGSPGAFSFDAVSCEQIGIGFDCQANVVFAPNAIGDFLSEFEISAIFEYEEIHGEEAGEIYQYGDAFRASFSGTGIAPVPLPPAAAMFLAGFGLLGLLGLLGRVGRGKGAA